MKKLLFIFTVLLTLTASAQKYITKEPKGPIIIIDLNGFDIPVGKVTYDKKLERKSGRISFYKLQSICIDCFEGVAGLQVNPKEGNKFIDEMCKEGIIDSSFQFSNISTNRIVTTYETKDIVEISLKNYYCVYIDKDNKTTNVRQVAFVLEKKQMQALLKEGKLEEYLFSLPNYF